MHSERSSVHRYILTAVFCLGAMLLALLAIAAAFDNRITQQQAHQIAEGMTKSEVVAILGEPHGRHNPDPENQWYYYCNFPTFHSDPLHVGFDDSGNVNWVSR